MEGARRGRLFLSWLSSPPVISPQILIPALMVTAEKDQVLVPEMSKHMENWVRAVLPGALGASWEGEGRCPRGKRQLGAEGDILMNHLVDGGFLRSITVTSWEQQPHLMLPFPCGMRSLIHSVAPPFVRFMGLCCVPLNVLGPC